ncbi:MAG: hypothetical protein LLG04_14345 [Parachlamydia sp.]|nr:hypothetical protein [Parachlamydia sp.]
METSAKKQISVTHTIEEGWKVMLANFGSILLLIFVFLILLLLITLLFSFLALLLENAGWHTDWVTYPGHMIINSLTALATANTTLKLADGQKIHIRDLFSKLPLFLRMLVANLLYLLAVVAGLICLIIPGIILAIRLNLFDLFIVDQGSGPIDALQKSYQTLRGYSWRWFGYLILSFLILLLGLLFFGIGLLLAFPTVAITRALLYRKLTRINPDT